MGHLVTLTPKSESLSFVFPSLVRRRDSTITGPGRREDRADWEAAGDLAGPRNWAMWE